MKKSKIIFSDFDGTLTDRALCALIFFEVFELSHRLGAEFVVVTGRPLSWSHFLMSHTPMVASISEGGGVLTVRERRRFKDIYLSPEEDISKLSQVTKTIFEKVPGFFKR